MDATEIASGIFAEARLSLTEPVRGGPAVIARRLELEIYDHPHARDEATLATWAGRTRIVLRSGLELERGNFLVAQMIARLRLQQLGKAGVSPANDVPELERAVAAWLAIPPEPFRRRYHQVGLDVAELARPFVVTRTAVALRLHEVVGLDVAVVGNRIIHRRGPRFWWMADEELRALAAKRSLKSIRKVQLRDDGQAVALLAS